VKNYNKLDSFCIKYLKKKNSSIPIATRNFNLTFNNNKINNVSEIPKNVYFENSKSKKYFDNNENNIVVLEHISTAVDPGTLESI
jgi:hypothetical protein